MNQPNEEKNTYGEETGVDNQRYTDTLVSKECALTEKSVKTTLTRLAKATGHLYGVLRMIKEGRDCADVLIQITAVRSALNGICVIILSDYLSHSVIDAIKNGDMETVDKFTKTLDTLLK
jgi:DNA-binding FrmR family transcriptional regulator